MENKIYKFFIALIILISSIGLLTNLHSPELRGEEPLRIMVSYEMDYLGNYLKPTLLGEPYTHKPPLYNWAIIISSKIFGWSEATIRSISIFFTVLTTLAVIVFSYFLLKNLSLSLLSGAIYITFLDVIAYYGWIGEMDSMFTFFVFLLFILVFSGFYLKKNIFLYTAGFYTGFIFLFKGFNAFPFFALTYIAGVIFFRRFDLKTVLIFSLSIFLSLIIPLIWFLSLGDFKSYFTDLSGEVINRVEYNFSPLKVVEHFLTFPVINFKQLLITSFFLLLAVLFYKKDLIHNSNSIIKLLILIAILNYIPYILLAGGSSMYKIHGRHIMPIFPVLAVIAGYYMYRLKHTRLFTVFLIFLFIISILRIPYGTEILSNLGKPSRKEIAQDMANITTFSKKVACDKNCTNEKAVCFYYSVISGSLTMTPSIMKNWEFVISCQENKDFYLIKSYKGKYSNIFLYKRKNGENL